MVGPAEDPRREPHQPASSDDLAAHPPADARCERVRGLLRDFVDEDLGAELIAEVEAHVHECRPCALALSRAESERMQIVQALSEVAPSEVDLSGPSEGFTAAVMSRVRELAEVEPPVGFTQRVMARVREDALADEVLSGGGADRRRRRLRRMVALAATILLSTLAGLLVFESQPAPEVEVLSADRAVMIRDGVEQPLVATDQWSAGERRAGDRFETGQGGALDLVLHPGAAAVRLRAEERTGLRIATGTGESPDRVALLRGSLRVHTGRPLAIGFADGSRVEFDRGRYQVAVDGVRHLDARRGVRVEVRVDTGAAEVIRGEIGTALVPGRVGTYTTFSGVRVDPVADPERFGRSRRRGATSDVGSVAERQPAEPPFGELLHPRTGMPVADATVRVSHFRGGETVRTDRQGRFWLSGIEDLRGQFLVLRAVPPNRQAGLAPMPATPVLVGSERIAQRFRLPVAGNLAGRIHDANGRAVRGLSLHPCRVDEVFGTVVPVGEAHPVGDDGGFTIPGLSMEPVPGESILLIALAPGRRPVVVWAGAAVRSEDAALDLVVESGPASRFGGFEAEAIVHLLLPVTGAPIDGVLAVRTVRADAAGQIAADLPDRSFLLDANRAPRTLVRNGDRLEILEQPAPPALRHLRSRSLAAGRLHWLHDGGIAVAHRPNDGSSGYVSVQERASGQACPGARVYQQAPDGTLSFLGVFDGRGALSCAATTEGQLIARTADGRVGRLDLEGALARSARVVSVDRPARIRWSGAPDALLILQRATPDGEAPVIRRGSVPEWTLLPGRYRVGESHIDLFPGTTTKL